MSDENTETKSNNDSANNNDSSKSSKVFSTSNGNNSGRRSTRLSRTKTKSTDKRFTLKGKSRRSIFKSKPPSKTSPALANLTWSEYIFFQGLYFQAGDIVSVVDEEDGLTYYAQCRCFMADQFAEKFVVLQWLFPTNFSSTEALKFQPSNYILGPEEDFPRRMECVTFVCNAPSDYYKPMNMPYPVMNKNAGQGKRFISTLMT